jgi:two-component system sensor histidine kinase EvgS
MALSAPQQQWLENKHALVVGILPTDAPPYGIRNTTRQYEGMRADYIGLIAEQLGLQVAKQHWAKGWDQIGGMKWHC